MHTKVNVRKNTHLVAWALTWNPSSTPDQHHHFSNPAVNGGFYWQGLRGDFRQWWHQLGELHDCGSQIPTELQTDSKNRSGGLFLADHCWGCKFAYHWQLKTWDGCHVLLWGCWRELEGAANAALPFASAGDCDADVRRRSTERSISLIRWRSRISI